MLLGQVVTILDGFFLKHSPVFIFCLMNLVMISQTARYWSSDGLSEGFKVGEREFDF